MGSPRTGVGAALLAGTLAWSLPLHAAEPTPEASPESGAPAASTADAEDEGVEVVVTGSRTPESVQRATVRTTVISEEEMRRRGARDAAEALSGELGVQVNPGAYDYLGHRSAIQIQGFDLERVLVLEDGERIIGDTAGAIDLGAVPLVDLARIEVVTGPTSALYGTGALGGVVNLLTAPPQQEGVALRGRLEGRYPWAATAEARGAWRGGDDWLVLDASERRSEGVRLDLSRPDLTLPALRRSAVGLRAGTHLGQGTDLRLRARYLREQRDGLISQSFPGLGLYLVDTPELGERYVLQLSSESRVSSGASVRVSANSQWARAQVDKDRRNSPVDERSVRQQRLQSLELSSVLVSGAVTTVVGARVEAEHLSQQLSKYQASGDTEVSDEVTPALLASVAGFGQVSWRALESLTLMGGVRGEQHRRFGGVVAPRLAAALRPSSWLTVQLAAGRGFRAPTANEYGFAFDHSFLGYRVLGNPNLHPERSWGGNFDVTAHVEPALTFHGGVFANTVSELIDLELAGAGMIPGVADYRYVNVGSARTAGAEVQLSHHPAGGVHTRLGYAYLFARDDTNHRPLPSRPPHTVTASLDAPLPAELSLSIRWRAITSAFVDVGVDAPGWMSLDTRLERPLGDTFHVYAGVLDALGARREPYRTGDQRPIVGRSVYLGVTADWPGEAEQ